METPPAEEPGPPTAARVRPRRDAPRTLWIRRILLIAVLAIAGVSIVRSLNDRFGVPESIWVREDAAGRVELDSDIADEDGRPLNDLYVSWVGQRTEETQGRRDLGITHRRRWKAVYRGPSGEAVQLPRGRYHRFDIVR